MARAQSAVVGFVAEVPYVGPFVRRSTVTLRRRVFGVEVVEVLGAHVAGGARQGDEEVAGEDVLDVGRVDEHVGERRGGVADVLGAGHHPSSC